MFIFGHAPPPAPSASFKYANFGAAAHELGIGRLRSLRASELPVPRPPSGPMGVRGAGGPPKNTRGRPRARCRRGPTGIELKGSAGIETVTADACAKLYTIGLMLPPKPAPVAGKCRRRRCDAPLRCRPNDHQGTTPSTERGCRLSSRGHATRAGPSASAPWSCRARSLTAAASVKSQWQCCCSGPRCGPRST